MSVEAVTRSQAESKPRLVVMATGAHPEVRAEKQSRSNVEQAAGQSREVTAGEPDEVKARQCSTPLRLQG